MRNFRNIGLLLLLFLLVSACTRSSATTNEKSSATTNEKGSATTNEKSSATSSKVKSERFAQANTYYEIYKFVDGDTFWITDGNGRKEKIRFIGIDAPEPRDAGKKKKQPYGEEASAFVKKFLKGKKVRLEFDVQKYDLYKRTLAYIWLEDGTLLNDYIVRNGYAQVSTFPPNVKYQERFLKSQRYARENKLGMWQ